MFKPPTSHEIWIDLFFLLVRSRRKPRFMKGTPAMPQPLGQGHPAAIAPAGGLSWGIPKLWLVDQGKSWKIPIYKDMIFGGRAPFMENLRLGKFTDA